MAGYKELVDDLFALLNANATFKNSVSRHNFDEIADTGDVAVVIRVGGFTSDDEAFGGVYGIEWDLFTDIYVPYSTHIEEDVDILLKARDTLVDLIEKNIYLGKGAGSASKIEWASIVRGDNLGVVIGEDSTVTHYTLSILVRVRQQHSVTLAE